MNWGNRLVVLFVCFAALICTLVYKCMHQNFELVSADYYNQEIRYQEKIDGMNNANLLSPLQIFETGKQLAIQLPAEEKWGNATGQVWFYCAGKASNDRKVPLQVSDGVMLFDKDLLARTRYIAKISWQQGEKKYYTERTVTIK